MFKDMKNDISWKILENLGKSWKILETLGPDTRLAEKPFGLIDARSAV